MTHAVDALKILTLDAIGYLAMLEHLCPEDTRPMLIWGGISPPQCDCGDRHRWNCDGTPLWAQTVRDLDTNPWTVMEGSAWAS